MLQGDSQHRVILGPDKHAHAPGRFRLLPLLGLDYTTRVIVSQFEHEKPPIVTHAQRKSPAI
jgi:hypothetical protein